MSHAVVVNGAAGRMGRLVAMALVRAGCEDVVGCDPGTASPLGLETGPLPLVDELAAGVARGGVVVDFSRAASTPALARAAEERGARLVVGTTGQSAAELEILREASGRVAVVLARNFSYGLNRLLEVLPLLRDLIGNGFDVECLEAHHRGKADAPSGTALVLLEALCGPVPAGRQVHGRHGSQALRQPGEVGVHSLRLGQVIGEHALFLGSDHEVIEIRHRALDRGAFVTGVIPAVRFVRARGPGLYTMLDVIRHAETTVA